MFEWAGMGALVALAWSALGYAVAKVKNNENFDPEKFVKTLIIGMFLAGLGQALGISIDTLEGYSLVQLLTIVVDKIASLFVWGKQEL